MCIRDRPVAVRADHLHGRSVGKLGEGGVVHSRTRADIQIAAARGDGAGLPGVIFAGTELDTCLLYTSSFSSKAEMRPAIRLS